MVAIGVREMAAAVNTLGRGRLARYAAVGTSNTDRFERELAAFTGAQYVRAMNSGTNALVCALVGLGVGPGDEVLVPAYTWVSSATAAVVVGAVPVLVDIDDSLTIDPEDLRRKITPRSKAIVPVHMLNLVCDMDRIMAIAREHDLVVVEDACQAVGVTYRGQRVGTIGDAGAYSFQQAKNIKSGEGGAVLTDSERVHVRATMFHDVGHYIRSDKSTFDEPPFIGFNMRMPELASAILRPQLRRLDRQLARRRERREMIIELLAERPDVTIVPHHDEPNAVGLAVSFATGEEASRFAASRLANRLIDTGRHVYTNWQPLLARRTFDARIDPWADSKVEYPLDACTRTLDILERTCSVSLDPDVPMPVMRRFARQMVATGRP